MNSKRVFGTIKAPNRLGNVLSLFCFILLTILAASVSFAFEVDEDYGLKETTTYSNGNSITFNDTEYEIIIGISTDSLAFKNSDGKLTTLHASDCLVYEGGKVCFEEKPTNTTVRLLRYEIKPELEFFMDENESVMSPGQIRFLNFSVRNIGNDKTSKYIVEQVVPKELSPHELRGCTYQGGTVRMSGSMESGYSNECSYKIKAGFNGTFDIYTNLTYHEVDEYVDIDIEDFEVEIVNPFNLTINFSNQNVSVGEPIDLIINFSNNNTEQDLRIRKIEIYDDYPLIRVPYDSDDDFEKGLLIKSKKIKKNESLMINSRFRFSRSNDYYVFPIEITYGYYDTNDIYLSDEEYTFELDYILSAYAEEISFNTTVISSTQSNVTLLVLKDVPNGSLTFSDPKLNISYNGTMLGKRLTLGNVSNIVSFIPLPNIKSYDYEITYQDSFKNQYTYSGSFDVDVEPLKELEIEKEIKLEIDASGNKYGILSIYLSNPTNENITTFSFREVNDLSPILVSAKDSELNSPLFNKTNITLEPNSKTLVYELELKTLIAGFNSTSSIDYAAYGIPFKVKSSTLHDFLALDTSNIPKGENVTDSGANPSQNPLNNTASVANTTDTFVEGNWTESNGGAVTESSVLIFISIVILVFVTLFGLVGYLVFKKIKARKPAKDGNYEKKTKPKNAEQKASAPKSKDSKSQDAKDITIKKSDSMAVGASNNSRGTFADKYMAFVRAVKRALMPWKYKKIKGSSSKAKASKTASSLDALKQQFGKASSASSGSSVVSSELGVDLSTGNAPSGYSFEQKLYELEKKKDIDFNFDKKAPLPQVKDLSPQEMALINQIQATEEKMVLVLRNLEKRPDLIDISYRLEQKYTKLIAQLEALRNQ